jgi:hypothetical protein
MNKLKGWGSFAFILGPLLLCGAEKPFEAGEGEYARFWFPSPNNSAQDGGFVRRDNYVRVSVVSWFANKDSDWWKDRMVSATCQVTLGSEAYDVALGTLSLEGGAHTAPTFDKLIVDNRLWVEGSLSVKAFLRASQIDTVLAGILKDMAKSSLGIASTAVEGYASKAAAGPYAPLLSAGQTLVSTVQNLISKAPKPLVIFEPDGFDVTAPTSLSELRGKVNYLLLLRANPRLTTRDSIRIVEDPNGVVEVLSHGTPLKDGAWMLLRIAKESVYGRARTWEDESEALQLDITGLVDQLKAGIISNTQALAKLTPSTVEAKTSATTQFQTLGDRVVDLQSLISHDSALSKSERGTELGKLQAVWTLALAACRGNNPSLFSSGTNTLLSSLHSGALPKDPLIRNAFRQSSQAVTLIDDPGSRNVGSKSSDQEIWNIARQIQTERERTKKERHPH